MYQLFCLAFLCLVNPSASLVLHGYKVLNAGWNMTLDLEIIKNSSVSQVLITMHGPTDRWFGMGFGASAMSGTYAITSTGSSGTITERKLGNHNQGTTLSSSVTILSNVNNGNGFRTVKLSRSITGSSSSYYTFPTTASTINMICARGESSGDTSLAFHGSDYDNTPQISVSVTQTDPPSKSPTKRPTATPTTASPTLQTTAPTRSPSNTPTTPIPSKFPTSSPSRAPTAPTASTTSTTSTAPTVSTSKPIYYGFAQLNSKFGQDAYVTVSQSSNYVKMELHGKGDNTWFGVGFDGSQMDGTYAIVVTDTVNEYRLGNHESGDVLPKSFWNSTIKEMEGKKTVVIEMPYRNNSNFDWQKIFENEASGSNFDMPMIWSKGVSDVFDYHETNRGLGTMTFSTKGFQANLACRVSYSFAIFGSTIVALFILLL